MKKVENNFPCKFCGGIHCLQYTSDETFDGAYDRYHYICNKCGKSWTVVDEVD